MQDSIGKLVRFNSHSTAAFASRYGTQQITVEASAVGIMLNYSPENLCEVLLHGDVVFNIDPEDLEDITYKSTLGGPCAL